MGKGRVGIRIVDEILAGSLLGWKLVGYTPLRLWTGLRQDGMADNFDLSSQKQTSSKKPSSELFNLIE
jgi:hypothetical protein